MDLVYDLIFLIVKYNKSVVIKADKDEIVRSNNEMMATFLGCNDFFLNKKKVIMQIVKNEISIKQETIIKISTAPLYEGIKKVANIELNKQTNKTAINHLVLILKRS